MEKKYNFYKWKEEIESALGIAIATGFQRLTR
jgi:hypothetical protein